VSKEINADDLKVLGKFDSLIRGLYGVGVASFLVSAVLFFQDSHYFFFSYLTSFSFYLTITLGAMFIVMIQFITRAGWSVVVRRVPEVLMKNMSLMFILAIPLFFGMHDLFHWTHADAVATDHLLKGKQPYLNTIFFCARIIFYFVVWNWISNKFFKGSTMQDESGDPEITLELQKRSTYSLILFALTLTFAAVDLIMSLTPHWYSTIFGVYIFAGAAVSSFSVVSLIYLFLRKRGFLKDIVSVEHFHDLGKLVYGFNIFWSYIAFCQFFLIWYANVPEETIFYALHFEGSWSKVALLLSVGHFGIPFAFFMSRHAKRNLSFHALMVIWILMMHFVDLYWIIMPNISKASLSIHVIDISLFVGFTGVFFATFFNRLKQVSLIPKKDPRLSESLEFHNY